MSLLLIGATGMLATAARHMAARVSGDIAVVSRNAGSFSFGDDVLDTRVSTHRVDWADQRAFLTTLDAIATAQGAFTGALVWMHGRDDTVRAGIAHHMADGGRLVEVLGSAASRPGAFGEIRVRQMRAHPDIVYRQVLLGFVHAHGQSRWLTHDEISAGAIAGFRSSDTITIAGQMEPWSLRP